MQYFEAGGAYRSSVSPPIAAARRRRLPQRRRRRPLLVQVLLLVGGDAAALGAEAVVALGGNSIDIFQPQNLAQVMFGVLRHVQTSSSLVLNLFKSLAQFCA